MSYKTACCKVDYKHKGLTVVCSKCSKEVAFEVVLYYSRFKPKEKL